MDVIKVGIIGCGVISQTYIRDIRELYQESGGVRLELAACGDVDMEKAQECAEKYHIPEYGLPEVLLKKEDLQILINLTPPRFHFELNKQILEAGKHLFCEKPFALTTEQAAELKALAEKKNLKIGSAPRYLFRSRLVPQPVSAGCGRDWEAPVCYGEYDVLWRGNLASVARPVLQQQRGTAV